MLEWEEVPNSDLNLLAYKPLLIAILIKTPVLKDWSFPGRTQTEKKKRSHRKHCLSKSGRNTEPLRPNLPKGAASASIHQS